jgi:aerobic-type carbon monoxide dehydrogenase small subunit (CoxS/CutS family)
VTISTRCKRRFWTTVAFNADSAHRDKFCSALAMLHEVRSGMPSAVTLAASHESGSFTVLSDDQIRERMAGNICQCGAYPNIVAAIRTVQQRTETAENSRCRRLPVPFAVL